MKSILLLGTVMLLSWTLPTWANPAPVPANPAPVPTDPAPVSVDQPETTEATTLNTVEVGIEAPSQNESERLNTLSQQINQTAGIAHPQSDAPLAELKQGLNLPSNLVIRGTSGGGLAIGTEY